MICSRTTLLRTRMAFGLAWILTGFWGCQRSTPEEETARSRSKTPTAIHLDHQPTPLPAETLRPAPPDPLSRVIETIEARGGKVSRDETGVTAIDWHRAPIHNLDLELLTEVPTLKRLYLSGTKIDSRGWVYLSALPNLERVALWRTPFTDEDLQYLAHAKNLQVLDLSQTPINGSGFVHLAKCQNLETLILKETRCQNPCVPHIARLRSLKVLDVQQTQIRGAGIAPLRALPKLEELRMHHQPGNLPYLAEFPNIRKLSLSRYAFPHPMRNLDALGKMKALETIEAEGDGVRDAFFEQVSQCPNLREIRVHSAAKFTDAGLAHLTARPTLRLLDVRKTKATPEGLRQIARGNSRVRIVVNPIELHRLEASFHSMGLGATHSRDGGPRLRLDREMHIIALRLEDAKIFLPSLQFLAKAIDPEKLEHLGLGHTDLTDEGLAHFRAGANLKHLNLRDTKITTEGLKTFGGGRYPELPSLETLDLSGMTLDEDCLKWIGTLDRLKSLRLAGVQGVTETDWANLRRLPNLERFEK